MTNEDIVKFTNYYQENSDNPILCKRNCENQKLYPVLIEDRIYLECLKCPYLEETIPDYVFNFSMEAA